MTEHDPEPSEAEMEADASRERCRAYFEFIVNRLVNELEDLARHESPELLLQYGLPRGTNLVDDDYLGTDQFFENSLMFLAGCPDPTMVERAWDEYCVDHDPSKSTMSDGVVSVAERVALWRVLEILLGRVG